MSPVFAQIHTLNSALATPVACFESLHKLGEIVPHGKNISATMCGWSKWPNKVDAQMMPRRDNRYWVKL